MNGRAQLCRHCHEVTERTSDGDRVACSLCGRPYPPPAQPGAGAAGPRPAGPQKCDTP